MSKKVKVSSKTPSRVATRGKEGVDYWGVLDGSSRSLVENSPDFICTISLDGKFTSLNPAFETITGWARSQCMGKPFAGIVHPDDLPEVMKSFQNAIQQGSRGEWKYAFLAVLENARKWESP